MIVLVMIFMTNDSMLIYDLICNKGTMLRNWWPQIHVQRSRHPKSWALHESSPLQMSPHDSRASPENQIEIQPFHHFKCNSTLSPQIITNLLHSAIFRLFILGLSFFLTGSMVRRLYKPTMSETFEQNCKMETAETWSSECMWKWIKSTESKHVSTKSKVVTSSATVWTFMVL